MAYQLSRVLYWHPCLRVNFFLKRPFKLFPIIHCLPPQFTQKRLQANDLPSRPFRKPCWFTAPQYPVDRGFHFGDDSFLIRKLSSSIPLWTGRPQRNFEIDWVANGTSGSRRWAGAAPHAGASVVEASVFEFRHLWRQSFWCFH